VIRHRTLRLIIASTLLALLITTFMAFTVSAHTLPTVHGVTTQVVNPNSMNPNSNMKLNLHGKVVFKPNTLACKQVQGQSCNTITNKTTQTIDVYLNGSFFFSSAPGQVNSFFYGGPGTYVYTIPNTNPKAKLTVTVKV
jgi:hypothetical protein